MQTLGPFQVVHRSTCRTRLAAPVDPLSTAHLVAVRRRLMACDGIEDVLIGPDAASVLVRHTAEFRWSSIGPAALRLDDDPVRRAPDGRIPHPPGSARPIGLVEEIVVLALETAVARPPARQIVLDIALSFLRGALDEARRA